MDRSLEFLSVKTFDSMDLIQPFGSMIGFNQDFAKGSDEEKMRRVAESFDAIFARQMLKEMRSSALKSDLFGKDHGSDLYFEMFDDFLAEAIGKAGGFGLGKMILQEMASQKDSISPEMATQLYKQQQVSKHI